MTRPILCGVAVSVLLSVASPDARACGYHGILGNGFSAQYPGSINVAIALREAAEGGLIDPQSLMPKSADLLAYHRTEQRLRRIREAVAQNQSGQKLAFWLLLVESGLWSRYTSDGENILLAVHVDPPQDGEAVMITGDAVLAAIEDGKLSWQDAMQRNLLVAVPGSTGDLPRVPMIMTRGQ